MRRLVNLRQVSGPGKQPWERRLLLWLVVAAVGVVVVITAAYYFDVVTESREFCGLLCHSNTPQYVAQEVSPHANVECGICHIGPGLIPKVMAKVYGTGELYKQLTDTFERPIRHPVSRLRPADEICEQCHTPLQPYEDRVKRLTRFADDEGNSETRVYLAMQIEPGTLESGAHWHIGNPVSYISRDEVDYQDIPWVEVRGDDGQMVVYQATEGALSAAELEDLPRRKMDCMDCHNRATHQFRKPEDRMDEALARGEIDADLPYVKREAMKLLSASYPTQEAGQEAMEGLAQFYQSTYPDVYADKKDAIESAVGTLREIYGQTVFPEMRLTWDVYPDNLGHTNSPGCFRCHDGEHVSAQGKVIPNDCTFCHSVPVSVEDDRALPTSPANAVFQPERAPASHRTADFRWEHRILAGDACADCHGPIEYGTDNSSFCANGFCHGQEWPEPAVAASFVHPDVIKGRHVQATCNECHQGVREPSIEDCATCHQPPTDPHFGSACAQCHSPEGWEESGTAWAANAPSNPHGIETVDCALCHQAGGSGPLPATHREFPAESCSRCHKTTFAAQVPNIPHAVPDADGRGDCLTCHNQGALQPKSALHRGAPSETCLQCHTSVPIGAVPIIPHPVEATGRCLACHGEDRVAPLPSGHIGWPDEACLLCHKAALPG